MSIRAKPKHATRNANDGAWTTCDSCGLIWNQRMMSFQYDFRGGYIPENTRFLKCPRCLDLLNYQRKLIIIPMDPVPLMNTRPEQYLVDESNYLATFTGQTQSMFSASQYDTLASVDYVTSIPSPADPAQAIFAANVRLLFHLGSVTNLFLDLFFGDPSITGGNFGSGQSVLAKITGSATRTNVGSTFDVGTLGVNIASNRSLIPVFASSLATINVTHVAFYDSATGGHLLTSGKISIVAPSIVQSIITGYGVAFKDQGIVINLN